MKENPYTLDKFYSLLKGNSNNTISNTNLLKSLKETVTYDKRSFLSELNHDYNDYNQFSTINTKRFGDKKK